MNSDTPQVSVGLPVWNGEKYLRAALDSLLAQTFRDFELIISNNGSTDGTDEICREYARKDSRIRYYSNPENRGAAWNFNRVFGLSGGEYFAWAAHDDVYAPKFLEKCVEVLSRDPAVALCHTRTSRIDESGEHILNYEVTLGTDSPKPSLRFYYLTCVNHPCFQVFGLIRSEALRKTRLFAPYKNADRMLLVRLGLMGRFYEVPEYLYFNRLHPEQSVRFCFKPYEYYAWWDPASRGRLFVLPQWRLLFEYCKAVWQAPISAMEQLRCYRNIVVWVRLWWPRLLGDIRVVVVKFFRRLGRRHEARERLASSSDSP